MNLAYPTQQVSITNFCTFPEDQMGFSEASKRFCGYLNKVREHFLIPATRLKALAIWDDACLEIVENNLVTGWDGYGALPVSERTIEEADKFIRLLPMSSPAPDEISADSDGDIIFEWYKNTNYLFNVSISEKKIIAYAGIFGPYSKVHGSDYFDYKIPITVIEHIKKFK